MLQQMDVNTALMRGDFKLLRSLVESGSDVNLRDKEYRTALINCCLHDAQRWALGSARLLLTYGAKVSYCDRMGRNALMFSVMYRREDLVKLFLTALDCDLADSDKWNRTVFWYATFSGNQIIESMIKEILNKYGLLPEMSNKQNLKRSRKSTQQQHKICATKYAKQKGTKDFLAFTVNSTENFILPYKTIPAELWGKRAAFFKSVKRSSHKGTINLSPKKESPQKGLVANIHSMPQDFKRKTIQCLAKTEYDSQRNSWKQDFNTLISIYEIQHSLLYCKKAENLPSIPRTNLNTKVDMFTDSQLMNKRRCMGRRLSFDTLDDMTKNHIKNGTPRQPSVCSLSRGCLRISKSIFNNPEHSLIGLEQFSHVWILFVFHKNGQLSCKAKVQPPRLNGKKTGVFSTRSPHRPNAIGLTLARLDKVEGDTLYFSGIDIIHGTPVLDIKPYITEYDSPHPRQAFENYDQEIERIHKEQKDADLLERNKEIAGLPGDQSSSDDLPEPNQEISPNAIQKLGSHREMNNEDQNIGIVGKLPSPVSEKRYTKPINCDMDTKENMIESTIQLPSNTTARDECKNNDSFVPSWVKNAPVAKLSVRFTPHAENELKQFKAPGFTGELSFRYFQTPEEAKCAIINVLCADPRSVYRRKQCQDRLFYFSLDTVHITCWFGDGFAEVLCVQPFKETCNAKR
ncbi:hypothetical protein GDO86_001294 [Hymenochirus boettgeri]|uniref:tRNA (adenine(37)-N6)-methyltransferase n=1 Tax=Hymenochirus boettgeri TaxID=247094 RepID=A0A8T2KHL5_9PIPI|nr:hypothetical protein GDO86_001294 [Hymenochirus boettgeri]